MPAPSDWHRTGTGLTWYSNCQRRNATVNQPEDPSLATARNIADMFAPSARSVQRWQKRVRDLGNPDRLGAKGLRGKFKLSRRGAFIILYSYTQSHNDGVAIGETA